MSDSSILPILPNGYPLSFAAKIHFATIPSVSPGLKNHSNRGLLRVSVNLLGLNSSNHVSTGRQFGLVPQLGRENHPVLERATNL
jgi:hypothetical protein